MSEVEKYTQAEAHKMFARTLNGKTWELLEKADRSKQENELMVHTAHASNYHWLQVGTGVNHQRGEWLIARVYLVLEMTDAALRHANRCLELTEEHADLMEDFDLAFAYEGIARANAAASNKEKAQKYILLAQQAGEAIGDQEDKEFFFKDFDSGDWKGLK
ncbi:MAG: hypothetical protein FVQ83_04170 [Chloroflexi bacterium]|nr:hypothetical protein [Chloroflexota bacterium]